MYLGTLSRVLTALNVVAKCIATLPPHITPGPLLIPRAGEPGENSPSCAAFYSLVKSCIAAAPGFLTLATSSQLSCLCYSSSTLVPTIYDNAFTTCLSYLKTASPSAYISLGYAQLDTMTAFGRTWETPCAEYATAARFSGYLTDSRVWACNSVATIISSCVSATPNFNNLNTRSQASCLCYLSGGSTYAPGVYDGYFSPCLAYYQTYDTSFYVQSLHGDKIPHTPCAFAGNVRNDITATGSAASALIPTQASAGPSVPLTTSEPQATARPNQASRHEGYYFWATTVGTMALPLLFALYL